MEEELTMKSNEDDDIDDGFIAADVDSSIVEVIEEGVIVEVLNSGSSSLNWDYASTDEEEMYEVAATQDPSGGPSAGDLSLGSIWEISHNSIANITSTTAPAVWELISGIEPRMMHPQELGKLLFHSAVWSVDTYMRISAERNRVKRQRDRAIIEAGFENACAITAQAPPRNTSQPRNHPSRMKPIVVSASTFAAGRIRVMWSCWYIDKTDCFEVELALKDGNFPLQSKRVGGRKFETTFRALSPATACTITVRRLAIRTATPSPGSAARSANTSSSQSLSSQVKHASDEEWTIAQETSLDIISPATPRLEWLPPSAPVSGSLHLTLFWEDCKHVSHWCVKCCDLREAAQGGRCAALGGAKSSDNISSPMKRFNVYSDGDNWRWKPIFSSFVDDTLNTSNHGSGQNDFQGSERHRSSTSSSGRGAAVENEVDNGGVQICTSYLGTCAEVISYERRRGTVRLQINLGSAGGGNPVDDDSCFSFLISGFVESSEQSDASSAAPAPTSVSPSSTQTTHSLQGEWSMPTRSLSLACDPTAQIPKRRAVDIPKSNAVRQDASVAAVIAASGRLATRAALAVATGIASGGPVVAVIDIAGAAATAALGRLGTHLRTTELTNAHPGLSLLSMGCGLDLGRGPAWRGLAADSLLNDVAHATQHGELDYGDCDFMKQTLQNEGFGAALSVMLALLHRRQPRSDEIDAVSNTRPNKDTTPPPIGSNNGSNQIPLAQVSLPMAEAVFIEPPLSSESNRNDTPLNSQSSSSSKTNPLASSVGIYLPLPLVPPPLDSIATSSSSDDSTSHDESDTLENAFSEALQAVEHLEAQVSSLNSSSSDASDEPLAEYTDSRSGCEMLQTSAMVRGEIEAMKYFDNDELQVMRNALQSQEVENQHNTHFNTSNITSVEGGGGGGGGGESKTRNYEKHAEHNGASDEDSNRSSSIEKQASTSASSVSIPSNPQSKPMNSSNIPLQHTNLIEIFPKVAFGSKQPTSTIEVDYDNVDDLDLDIDDIDMVSISNSENEFEAIASYLRSSLPHSRVVKIWRNENEDLWLEHIMYKKEMNKSPALKNDSQSHGSDNDLVTHENIKSLSDLVLKCEEQYVPDSTEDISRNHDRWLWHGTGEYSDPRLVCAPSSLESKLDSSSQCFSKRACYFDKINMCFRPRVSSYLASSHPSCKFGASAGASPPTTSTPLQTQRINLGLSGGGSLIGGKLDFGGARSESNTREIILSLVSHNFQEVVDADSPDVVTFDERQAYPAYIVRYQHIR